MRKLRILLCSMLVACLGLGLLGGCKANEEGAMLVYYVTQEETSITYETYENEEEGGEALVQELLDRLQTAPEDADLIQTIPSDVEILSLTVGSYFVGINFSEEYYTMSSNREVLTRAAIVRTLLQVENIVSVYFTVEGEALVDSMGRAVGSMTEDTFVDNPGEQINSSISTTLTLYYANSDGTALVTEEREVKYSSNTSLEKVVMQQLIAGAKESGHQSTLPSSTNLITIAVSDGICYVNLDESIKNQSYEISEAVVLYSIVNSLTAIPEVDKVQISYNGDSTGKFMISYDLSTLYEKDLSLLESTADTEETETSDLPSEYETGEPTEIELPVEGAEE